MKSDSNPYLFAKREVLKQMASKLRAAKQGIVSEDDIWGHGYNVGVGRCLGIIKRMRLSLPKEKP